MENTYENGKSGKKPDLERRIEPNQYEAGENSQKDYLNHMADLKVFGATIAKYFIAIQQLEKSKLSDEEKKDFKNLAYLAIAYEISKDEPKNIQSLYLRDMASAMYAEKAGLKGLVQKVQSYYDRMEQLDIKKIEDNYKKE